MGIVVYCAVCLKPTLAALTSCLWCNSDLAVGDLLSDLDDYEAADTGCGCGG